MVLPAHEFGYPLVCVLYTSTFRAGPARVRLEQTIKVLNSAEIIFHAGRWGGNSETLERQVCEFRCRPILIWVNHFGGKQRQLIELPLIFDYFDRTTSDF